VDCRPAGRRRRGICRAAAPSSPPAKPIASSAMAPDMKVYKDLSCFQIGRPSRRGPGTLTAGVPPEIRTLLPPPEHRKFSRTSRLNKPALFPAGRTKIRIRGAPLGLRYATRHPSSECRIRTGAFHHSVTRLRSLTRSECGEMPAWRMILPTPCAKFPSEEQDRALVAPQSGPRPWPLKLLSLVGWPAWKTEQNRPPWKKNRARPLSDLFCREKAAAAAVVTVTNTGKPRRVCRPANQFNSAWPRRPTAPGYVPPRAIDLAPPRTARDRRRIVNRKTDPAPPEKSNHRGCQNGRRSGRSGMESAPVVLKPAASSTAAPHTLDDHVARTFLQRILKTLARTFCSSAIRNLAWQAVTTRILMPQIDPAAIYELGENLISSVTAGVALSVFSRRLPGIFSRRSDDAATLAAPRESPPGVIARSPDRHDAARCENVVFSFATKPRPVLTSLSVGIMSSPPSGFVHSDIGVNVLSNGPAGGGAVSFLCAPRPRRREAPLGVHKKISPQVAKHPQLPSIIQKLLGQHRDASEGQPKRLAPAGA